MTQADSPDLGFPDTYREIRALTATGMDEAQAEAVVYASVRAANAAAIAGAARQSAASDLKFQQVDLKFQEVLHAIADVQKNVENLEKNVEDVEKNLKKDIEAVQKDIEAVQKDVENVEKNVAKDIEGLRKELDAKLANRLLGIAVLILGAAGAVIAVVLNAG